MTTVSRRLPSSFVRIKETKKTVLTSSATPPPNTKTRPQCLEAATRVLTEFDPATTIVNIGATPDGIGAVYEVAKRKGYRTSGIVSTQAKKSNVALSPCVDVVFYVADDSWGGLLPGTDVLSPTSAAMVEVSDVLVAIGGGEVARDELAAAKRMSKRVKFIAADMNHKIATEKARKQGRPAPADFRGGGRRLNQTRADNQSLIPKARHPTHHARLRRASSRPLFASRIFH
jgi:hypothetical protein